MGFLEQEGFLHALRQHQGLMLTDMTLDEQKNEEVVKGGKGCTVLPQGLDLSHLGEAEALKWRELYARVQVWGAAASCTVLPHRVGSVT